MSHRATLRNPIFFATLCASWGAACGSPGTDPKPNAASNTGTAVAPTGSMLGAQPLGNAAAGSTTASGSTASGTTIDNNAPPVGSIQAGGTGNPAPSGNPGSASSTANGTGATTGAPSASATSGGPSTSMGGGGSIDNVTSMGGGSSESTGGLDAGADSGIVTTGGSGGSVTGGTSGSSSGDAVAVTDLQIEANPRMGLAAYVSWTTAEPASSEVQFGETDYELRIVDDAMTTEHRVHVVGMHPASTYKIKAVSTTAMGSGSAEGEFTTETLPASVAVAAQANLIADVPEKSQRGWTLTNINIGGTQSFGSNVPPTAVILDEQGKLIWYHIHGTMTDGRGDACTAWSHDGTILLGGNSSPNTPGGTSPTELDLEANVLWTGPPQSSDPVTHHTTKLDNGNYLVTHEDDGHGIVQELDKDNNVVWEWSLREHGYPPAGTDTQDWCHLNSATLDAEADVLYMNCRWQGVFKIDRKTGDILWQLGAKNDDLNSGDFAYAPDPVADKINDTHDPEFGDDGTVLFYDNGGWYGRQNGNSPLHSRVIQYQLDESGKTATKLFEFPGDFTVEDSWYTETWASPYWGDADALANGNILVTAPHRGMGTETRIFEVTRSGEIVWAIAWPENNGSFRADRISPPPAEAIP